MLLAVCVCELELYTNENKQNINKREFFIRKYHCQFIEILFVRMELAKGFISALMDWSLLVSFVNIISKYVE
jgi:hypothetical protein